MMSLAPFSRLPCLVLTVLAMALSGCGGGSEAAAPTEVSLAAVVPAATMTWTTAADTSLALALRDAAGAPAVDATVRVFSFTMTNPQDGEALDAPMPIGEIASGGTDAGGALVLDLRVPARFDEVLVVATLGDQQISQRVRLNAGVVTVLTLQPPT